MADAPGRNYIGRPFRVTINYSTNDVDVDPDEVTLRVMSPSRVETSYVYDSGDGDIIRSNAGDYYYDIVTDEAGRWCYRWEATGTGTVDASEGDFLVMASAFFDSPFADYA